MKNLFIRLTIVFCLLSSFVAYGIDLSKAEKKLYKTAMKKVDQIECYSHFLEKEQKFIQNRDNGYEQIRWSFIKDVCYDNSKVASPRKALNQFIKACVDGGYLEAKNEEFIKSANILGYELITDYPKFTVAPDNYKVVRNIAYSTVDGYSQHLDLFLPKNIGIAPVPCVIFIHGGGWAVHKRAWMEGHAQYVASKGYASATIDYRMLNAVDPVECVKDAKAAVRWIRANAKKYGIDPNRIGASGGSAGAHLSAILATSYGDADLEGIGGNSEVSSQIQAAVGFATPALTGNRFSWPWRKGEQPEWFTSISPYKHISNGDAPMLFLHGDEDSLVIPDDAQDMHDRMKECGIYTELEYIKGKGHVFYMNEEIAERALAFFRKVFEKK